MASFVEGYRIVRKIGGNIAFLLALGLYCLTKCISRSELASIGVIPTLLPILTNIAIVALCCKIILLTAYRPIEVVIIIAIILVALQTCYMSGDDSFFIFSLFILSAKGVNARMMGIIALCVLGFCLALVIVLCLAGVLENNVELGVNQLLGGMEVARQRLGFAHENIIGQITLTLFLCYLFLRYKKFGVVDVLIWFAVGVVLFFVISTKTAAVIIVFGVVLVLVSKALGLKRSLILCVVLGCLSALAGICLGFIYDPDNNLLRSINTLLAGRLSYAHAFLSEYPVLPFGQELELISNSQAMRLGVSPRVLDNAYIKLLLGYGISSLIIALFAYGFSFRQAIKKCSVALAIAIVLVLLDGSCEAWFFGLVGIVALSMAFGEQVDPKDKRLPNGDQANSKDEMLSDKSIGEQP